MVWVQLPSSSTKFVNMTCDALASFEEDHGIKFAKVTRIPLEGDGTISRKAEKYVVSHPRHLIRSHRTLHGQDLTDCDYGFMKERRSWMV